MPFLPDFIPPGRKVIPEYFYKQLIGVEKPATPRMVFKNSSLPYDRITQRLEIIQLQKNKGKIPVLDMPSDTRALQIIYNGFIKTTSYERF
ncbi:MAG TPA: hypothetical protein VL125_08280 [Pelobium sp.]|nr:hypothetical protein [Pelobium sp.]